MILEGQLVKSNWKGLTKTKNLYSSISHPGALSKDHKCKNYFIKTLLDRQETRITHRAAHVMTARRFVVRVPACSPELMWV